MLRRLFIVLILLIIQSILSPLLQSQTVPCRMEAPISDARFTSCPQQDYSYGPGCSDISDPAIPDHCEGKVRIPFRLIRITEGGVSNWSDVDVLTQIDLAISMYDELSIELFNLAGEDVIMDVENDILYDFDQTTSSELTAYNNLLAGLNTTTVEPINITLHNTILNSSGDPIGGQGAFPNSGSGYLIAARNFSGNILQHEFGHVFGLFHTFEDFGGTSIEPLGIGTCDEGDRIRDTPGSISNTGDCHAPNDCVFQQSTDIACDMIPAAGQRHLDNVMSYSGICGNSLTPFQKKKIDEIVFQGCDLYFCVQPPAPQLNTSTYIEFLGADINLSGSLDELLGSNTNNCITWSLDDQNIDLARGSSVSIPTGTGTLFDQPGQYVICGRDIPAYNSTCASDPSCVSVTLLPPCNLGDVNGAVPYCNTSDPDHFYIEVGVSSSTGAGSFNIIDSGPGAIHDLYGVSAGLYDLGPYENASIINIRIEDAVATDCAATFNGLTKSCEPSCDISINSLYAQCISNSNVDVILEFDGTPGMLYSLSSNPSSTTYAGIDPADGPFVFSSIPHDQPVSVTIVEDGNSNCTLSSTVLAQDCNMCQVDILSADASCINGNTSYEIAVLFAGNPNSVYDVYTYPSNGANTYNDVPPGLYYLSPIDPDQSVTVRIEDASDPYNCFETWYVPAPNCVDDVITVTWPSSSGQCYELNDQQIITWTSQGNASYVNIEICNAANDNCEVISLNEVNDGSYSWTPDPGIIAGNYYIKIYDPQNTATNDIGNIFELTDDCNGACSPIETQLVLPNNLEEYLPGESFTLQWNPQNTGSGNCGLQDYHIKISSSPTYANAQNVYNHPVAFLTNSISTEGSYYWKVRARNENGDFGPWSDSRTLIICDPDPDCTGMNLELASCIAYPSTFCYGESATVSVSVKNPNDITFYGTIAAVLIDFSTTENYFIEQFTGQLLTPGQVRNYTFSNDIGILPSDDIYLLIAEQDSELNSDAVEDGSCDNVFLVDVDYCNANGEDFYVSNVSVSNSVVEIGDNLTIYCNQNYSGNVSTTQNVELEYGLSIDQANNANDIFLGTDFSSLSTSDMSDAESITVTVPSVTPGSYYIQVCADAPDDFDEDNENNNCSYVPIQIQSNSTTTTFVVDVEGDLSDNLPGDGVCADVNGDCSLRAAIEESNANSNLNTIVFESYIEEIVLTSEIETIIHPLTIDGGTTATVKINGDGQGYEISVESPNVTVYGLWFDNFLQEAISAHNSSGLVIGGSSKGCVFTRCYYGLFLSGTNASNIGIYGNYFGTDMNFNTGLSNSRGVDISGASGTNVSDITIGGALGSGLSNIFMNNTGAALLMSNSTNVNVYGNYFGTDPNDNIILGNGTCVFIDDGLVGGSELNRNIFKHSTGDAVKVQGPNVEVSYNVFYDNDDAVAVSSGSSPALVSRNAIWCNNRAIVGNCLDEPIITAAQNNFVQGTCLANATVEVYKNFSLPCPDNTYCQGKEFLGNATVTGTSWLLNGNFDANDQLSAIQIVGGHTSYFSSCAIVDDIDPFVFTIKTDNPGASCSTCFEIPTFGSGYSYDVDWENDGNFDEFGLSGAVVHDYGAAGTYTLAIRGNFPRIRFADYGLSKDEKKLLSIEQWGDIIWDSMEKAFFGCSNLNGNFTDAPNLSGVSNISRMFLGATSFNHPIDHWDVSSVTNMFGAFAGATSFNQPLNSWNVSNVTNMGLLFSQAYGFNQDIGNWDVSNVTNMNQMFTYCYDFNWDIGNWDVSNVINMRNMFAQAYAFNQDIGGWDVSNVTNMFRMFYSASSFNQDIGGWDVSSVTDMSATFAYAGSFDQDLGGWDISSVNNMFDPIYSLGMLSYSGLSVANYDSTLIGWSNLMVNNGVHLASHSLEYCDAVDERNVLISTYGWSITNDVMCSILGCTDSLAHNYNPNANSDDGSCETCTDGLMNGDELGIDCGGVLCTPCASGVIQLQYSCEDTLWLGYPASIDAASVTQNRIKVYGAVSGRAMGTIVVNDSSLAFIPMSPFISGEVVHIYSSDSIRDIDGNYFHNAVMIESIYAKSGTGEFYERFTGIILPSTMYGYSHQFSPSDINKDGIPDIVYRYHPSYGGNTSLVTYISNQDGSYQAPITYTESYSHSSYRGSPDLNGDGYPDIVITQNAFPSSLHTRLNNGDGTFASESIYALTNYSNGVEVGDMNGDGYLDVIGRSGNASISINTISTYLNDGNGGFGAQQTISTGGFGRILAPVDIDLDGDLDVIYGAGHPTYGGPKDIRTYSNNGAASYNLENTSSNSSLYSIYPHVLDFNADHFKDMQVRSVETGLKFGNGTFDYNFNSTTTLSSNYEDFRVADFDGDQDLDIFSVWGDSIRVYLNNGYGQFISNFQNLSITRLSYPDVADMDGDGDVDILFRRNDSLFIALNGLPSGCMDPLAHNYDPAAQIDDGSCLTCTDGMLNGDEIEVDCGGILCGPCNSKLFVDSAAVGANNGTSWMDAFVDLQDALDAATTNDTIWVANGTYYPTQAPIDTISDPRLRSFHLDKDVVLLGGFEGYELNTSDRNPDIYKTVLSGDIGLLNNANDNCVHVLITANLSRAARFDGIWIVDGISNNSISTYEYSGRTFQHTRGAGIYNMYSSPILSDVTISNCRAHSGSASYNYYSGALYKNVNFIDNGLAAFGAAAYNIYSPDLEYYGCLFYNNNGNHGGAVYNFVTSAVHIENSLFIENQSAANGGAIKNYAPGQTIVNCTFINNENTHPTQLGGAIFNQNPSSSTQIHNCIFFENKTMGSDTISGADIYENPMASTVTYCRTQKNSQFSGGMGILNNVDPLFSDMNNWIGQDSKWRTSDDGAQLSGGSGLINTGGDTALLKTSLDITKSSRIEYNTIDYGAYEFYHPLLDDTCTTVFQCLDSLMGSLAYAVECAEPNDTVRFVPWLSQDTIPGLVNPIYVDKDITIVVDTNQHVFLSGQFLLKALEVADGSTVKIIGLNIIASQTGDGVAIKNRGDLTLEHVNIHPAGSGKGIYIDNEGVLILQGTSQLLKE